MCIDFLGILAPETPRLPVVYCVWELRDEVGGVVRCVAPHRSCFGFFYSFSSTVQLFRCRIILALDPIDFRFNCIIPQRPPANRGAATISIPGYNTRARDNVPPSAFSSHHSKTLSSIDRGCGMEPNLGMEAGNAIPPPCLRPSRRHVSISFCESRFYSARVHVG